jgi:hypothetical protein
MEKQNYLFLGSSITYGSGSSGISVADMFAEDYAKVEFLQSIEGQEVRGVKYLRRLTESNDDSLNGWQGSYRCDDLCLVVQGNGAALFNRMPISYTLEGNTASVEPFGDYINFSVHFNQSDHVYKAACNGYKLAYATTATSPKTTSYVHLLLMIINQHKLITSNPDGTDTIVRDFDGQTVNQVFIQLSTNDAGQTDTVFGDINAEELDDSTSYGSIQYLVKLCKDTWGNECKITFFVCPRCDMPGSYGTRYATLREGLLSLRDRYQNFDVIDLWGNAEATSLVNSVNYSTYLNPDKVHPTEMGYERIFFPEFRRYMDLLNKF